MITKTEVWEHYCSGESKEHMMSRLDMWQEYLDGVKEYAKEVYSITPDSRVVSLKPERV